MKRYFCAIVALTFFLTGCGSVYIVKVSPENKNVSQELKKSLSDFYKREGFYNWRESEGNEHEFLQKEIFSPNSELKDMWIQPGNKKPNWDAGIYAFEYESNGLKTIRFVYQKGGNVTAAEKRAGIIAAKLKQYLNLKIKSVKVEVVESRSFDNR